MIAKPSGLPALVTACGDPLEYVNNKVTWEQNVLRTVPLPIPLPYAYAADVLVKHIRAHGCIVDHLRDTLMACLAAGVPPDRLHYGGSYCWRRKTGQNGRLSTHTWGLAVDVEPAGNPFGRAWKRGPTMLHPLAVRTFLDMGWTWGNDFSKPDAMHFQWVVGY